MHNGIIENAEQLRDALNNRGVTLVSDTDTEALAHMIAAEVAGEVSLEDAVRRVLRHVDGTYGLVVLDTQNPNELVVARNGSISAEHGIGQLKRELLRQVKDKVAMEVMRAIKQTLDPKNILNPGKVL